MSNLYMQPDCEPLRSLIDSANDHAVRDVDGVRVVRDGEVTTFDIAEDIAEDIAMLRRGQAEDCGERPPPRS